FPIHNKLEQQRNISPRRMAQEVTRAVEGAYTTAPTNMSNALSPQNEIISTSSDNLRKTAHHKEK
ncbi:MAG: hypothetical protein WD767_14875, partial [Alphaproteobacteria bacterium]